MHHERKLGYETPIFRRDETLKAEKVKEDAGLRLCVDGVGTSSGLFFGRHPRLLGQLIVVLVQCSVWPSEQHGCKQSNQGGRKQAKG